MSHRGTVIEVSGKEFIENSSQEKGFYKCKGCEDSFKSKAIKFKFDAMIQVNKQQMCFLLRMLEVTEEATKGVL